MPLAGEQKRVHNLAYYETRKELRATYNIDVAIWKT